MTKENDIAQDLYNTSVSITESADTIVTVQGKDYKVPILLAKVLSNIENLRFNMELIPEKDIKKKKRKMDEIGRASCRERV